MGIRRSKRTIFATHQTANRQVRPARSLLILTGHRRKHRHHLARFNGLDVWLTREAFRALCDLAFGLVRTETGLCQSNRRTIMRLRQELDGAFGTQGVGHSLIECGDKNKYRLTLRNSEIMIEPSFAELDTRHFSRVEVSDGLQRLCPMKRPSRYRDAT